MASYTTNLNLKKPAETEDINVADINGNTDILDTAIKALQDAWTTTSVSPTKTVGSKWTSGDIILRKHAGIVMIKLEGTVFSAVSSRETFAMVPEGYRPVTESYFFSADLSRSFLVTTGGEMKANSQPAGQCWGTECYIAG